MPRFAANLSLMYAELPFLERFGAAAADGFDAVECQFPYDWPVGEIAQRLQQHGLQQVLVNAPPGDWAGGERGLAALPGRQAEFQRALLEQALPYAQALGCRKLHLMAGLRPPGVAPEALHDTYLANLDWAARQTAGLGIELLIEPINPRDMPGYLLNHQAEAHAIVQAVGAAHLKVQMDLYHCQVVEGDLSTRLRQYLPTGRVGHLQVASVPARQEPDDGELNFPYLFALLDELGYAGHVGCEYRPRAGTSAGLGWFQPYRRR